MRKNPRNKISNKLMFQYKSFETRILGKTISEIAKSENVIQKHFLS